MNTISTIGPVLFTREGDYWNYYGDRAKDLAKVLDLVWTTRKGRLQLGIPDHSKERLAQELRDLGIDATFDYQ